MPWYSPSFRAILVRYMLLRCKCHDDNHRNDFLPISKILGSDAGPDPYLPVGEILAQCWTMSLPHPHYLLAHDVESAMRDGRHQWRRRTYPVESGYVQCYSTSFPRQCGLLPTRRFGFESMFSMIPMPLYHPPWAWCSAIHQCNLNRPRLPRNRYRIYFVQSWATSCMFSKNRYGRLGYTGSAQFQTVSQESMVHHISHYSPMYVTNVYTMPTHHHNYSDHVIHEPGWTESSRRCND